MTSKQPGRPEAAGEPLMRVSEVTRRYPDGEVLAVNQVSLDIFPGEYVAIMGPSGSGKSTLLNLMGGLDRPDAGEIFFRGQSLQRMPSLDRFRSRHLGFVFQSFHLLPTLTALENVQIPMLEGELSSKERTARAAELLNRVGLSHRLHHRPRKLSVGERQRVAIARALANQPELLLADEPTGNLDSVAGGAILDLFDSLHRDLGVTLVVITHGREVARRAERTLWIQDGRLMKDPQVLSQT